MQAKILNRCISSQQNSGEANNEVALKNYKSISEKQKELESRVQSCQEKLESCEELLRKTQSETRKSLQQISTEIQQSKPLTKREVLNLVQEIAEQPNQEAHHRMSLANLKATTKYQEAIQATEDIEAPAVGFAKTSDYKGASKQSKKLIELEEKFDRIKQKVHTIIEKEIQPADLEDSISSLAKRLDNFSISDDFHNHVEVAIQTHGYDTWQGGESNLLVTMAMIGRLSNTSYMGFQYNVDNVVDHLITTSITTIPGKRRSVEELEGMS
ncbi:hypothetical protein Tco_0876528 [Tanacetum coccineum]|uniref:Uncharacterized protein n=1 Tax=Tanacetum coccineum TaxID=301880 RepID=A0ABQ5BVD5_9ASTR